MAGFVFVGVDGKALRFVRVRRSAWLQPEYGLTLDRERQLKIARESGVPCSRGEHQAMRGVCTGASAYANSFAIRIPFEHGVVEACFRASGPRRIEMCLVARLRVEVAGPWVEHSDEVRREPECGEPLVNLRRSQNFVRKVVLARASQRAGDDHSVARADHEPARDLHQRCSARRLQLAPQFVRSLDQRHVQRMLEVGLANNATVPVRRAELVCLRELLESQNAEATACEMKQRRAAHRAQSDDNGVVATRLDHDFSNLNRLMETRVGALRRYSMWEILTNSGRVRHGS